MNTAANRADIALVFPPVEMRDRYYRIARWVTVPPQGLAFIAAVAERSGRSVAVIDAVAQKLSSDQILDQLKSLRPRYIGLTGPTMVIPSAADIALRVRKSLPGTPVIIGGPHLSAEPEETLTRYPQFDIGVVGEGETTILELLDALDKGRDLKNVKGLVLHDNGGFFRTPTRPLIRDLDTLPFPAYHLLPPLTKFYQHVVVRVDRMPSASLLISRGCAKGRCVFCSRDVYGHRVRIHSPEYSLALFDFLINKWGIRSINFEDEDLLAHRSTMMRLCEMMIARKTNLTWAISGRVDLPDEEMLALFKRAGCWHISFGIESGDQAVLDRIKKNITLEQVRTAVEMTCKAGISTKGYFMIGHPGETLETIQKTIDFSKSCGIDYFQMSYVAPLPGTELYHTAGEWGEFNPDWAGLNIWNPVFIPRGLSREILEKQSLRAFREFYFRPKILLRIFLRSISTRYIFSYLRDGFRFLGFLRRG